MPINFAKMHSLGNDFMVLDNLTQNIDLSQLAIAQLADRHRGVGFDQLLFLGPSPAGSAHFSYRIFNADGSEVGQCGNGARCAAYYLVRKQLAELGSTIYLQTADRSLAAKVIDSNTIQVNLGLPDFAPHKIPLGLPLAPSYHYHCGQQALNFYATSVGNPHAIFFVQEFAELDLELLGLDLNSANSCFPNGVNVSLVKIDDPQNFKIRTYERGVGLTAACGSAATAAVACARAAKLTTAKQIQVQAPGGNVRLLVDPQSQELWLIGDANWVYQGTLGG